MENKTTKKIMLDDDELEQVSGGCIGLEPKVGDNVTVYKEAELKAAPSEASGTIRDLKSRQRMYILEIQGDWYKVQLCSEDRIIGFVLKSKVGFNTSLTYW